MSAGAQGLIHRAHSIHKRNVSQTFILHGSREVINGVPSYVVNNVSYLTPSTPLKLADYYRNGSGVYQLDAFPVQSPNDIALYGISVVTGVHKGWLEIVFKNDLSDEMDSWHLDGFGFYVVGKVTLKFVLGNLQDGVKMTAMKKENLT
ncbi:UNVERIFIED_CONTAM: Monocopper oxidase-like protein SKS1 [Sesamum angustifolium]|uniref:Monocopper oxidase-like protein SKS1 n=1 Tax=Sesamum angustifolium TaxID=2727405 RepID=A0AAW2LDR8_9LAMI